MKPQALLLDYKPLSENEGPRGFSWTPMEGGGLLIVRRDKGREILILK